MVEFEKNSSKDNERDQEPFKTTQYVRSEFEYVINFSLFEKLMKNVKKDYKDKHLQLLFELLDFDKNQLLSKQKTLNFNHLLKYVI